MGMRLLVFDEELFAGGVETLCFCLLPALARLCEKLVWAVPGHLGEQYRARCGDVPNLVIENHNWPRGDVRRVAAKAVRLLPAVPAAASLALRNERIRSLARSYDCTHFLTTCIFSQPFPAAGLPVHGFVCDLNPDIPAATAANIVAWVDESAGIFSISEFVRGEVLRVRPACAGKINAVPLAAPPLESWSPKPAAQRGFDFYYPAAANPHKNHLLLFRACRMLVGAGFKFRLLLSGPDADGFRAEGAASNPKIGEASRFLAEHAEALAGVVHVVSKATQSEAAALYEDVRCVVLPSGHEGFGLPLAETLARGLPVICSDIPPFREQLALHGMPGNASIVPAGSVEHLAAAMEAFLKGAPGAPVEAAPCAPPWTWDAAAQRCFELLSAAPRGSIGGA